MILAMRSLTLGERGSGSARLEEAVGAYREALKGYSGDQARDNSVITKENLDRALNLLEQRKRR